MLSSSSSLHSTFALSFLSSTPISARPTPSRTRFSPSPTTATAASSCSDTCTEDPRMHLSGSPYEVLGVPVTATGHEIKAAYRRLARICHPDVAGTDQSGSSAEDFMKIHAAYSTLSDPERRAVYDRKILRRRIRPLTAGSVSVYRGRNWETDQCW